MYAAPNSLFSHNGAGHANTNIIYLITEVMYDSFTVAVDMDIHGYLCVDIRLGTATEVIGPIRGIRIINDFTICLPRRRRHPDVTEDVLCFLLLFLVLFLFLAEFTLASPLWK